MGVELPIAMRAGKKLMCPKCQADLTPVLTDGVEVDQCTKCAGVWVDFIDEKNFLQITPQVFTIDELRHLRRLYEPMAEQDPVQYRMCPVCADIMYRRNWGGNSGVIVDRCERHGTWFDPGEPEKIQEYVRLGGIEYEKLNYHETATAEVHEKLKREISRLDKRVSASHQGMLSRIWAGLI